MIIELHVFYDQHLDSAIIAFYQEHATSEV